MAGLIDVGIIKPELSNAFAAGYQGAEQARQQAQQGRQQLEINQIKLEQLKQDRAALTDLQAKLRAAGQSDDPKQFFQALIQTGNPDYVTKGYEGLQRYKELERADAVLRQFAPELFPAPAAPSAAAPSAAAPSAAAPAGPVANALAPANAPATSAVPANAMVATTAGAPDVMALRRQLAALSSVNDPRAKAMADVIKSQLQELVKPQTVAPGHQIVTGGQVTYTAPMSQTELQRNYEFARSQGFKGSLFDYERQIKEAGRAPVQPVAPTITTVEDPTAPGKFLQVDARIYRGGGAGSPGVIGGARPSATAEKTAAQRQQLSKDLDTAIFELKDAAKEGGLIDQSTGSGVGRLVDVGARMVGQATAGDIAIGKLKPIADIVLKMVPRFEGPQSDKDTQSYEEAAGQLADPGMPVKIRKEAAKTIIRLMENRKGQFVSADMAAEGAAPGGVDASNPLLAK